MTAYHKTIPLFLLTALAACGGGPKTDTTANDKPLVIGGDGAASPTSLYQMPTPNELFSIVREMAGEGQKRMMNPSTNADRYVTLGKRAANFGIYATDLIYASQFQLNVEVVRYYLTVKKLGDELGLAGAFSDNDFVRLQSNLAHGDSLGILSNDVYYRAYDKMQDEKMAPTLAIVLAGGWVESMHLVTRQVHDFDATDPLVIRVGEQKFTLEHLIDLMEPIADQPDVAPLRDKLIAIRSIYDGLEEHRSPHEGKSTSGRMVLGDDVQVTITAEQFMQLDKAVEALRDELTRTEDQATVKPNA